MKKTIFLFVTMLLSVVGVFAENVPTDRLIELGINAFSQRTGSVTPVVESTSFWVEDGDTVMIALNFQNGGFIILSTDDAAIPVIGYDKEESFSFSEMSPAASSWLRHNAQQISTARSQHLMATPEIAMQWEKLNRNEFAPLRDNTAVAPLIQAKWNQSRYYNDLCPADPDSPTGYGGRVPCGCVALAMAMVIHYYRYPATGQGSHSYYSNYGYHSVNYAQQTYNYNVMPYNLSKANNEVAKLIYHCGIAVEMNYAPEGSGAETSETRRGLRDYYKYAQDIAHERRSGGGWGGWGNQGYTTEQWTAMLKADIDSGRPIIYSGYSEEGGHAFICDGYDANDYFHFNWGWGGYNNGYFTVEDVTTAVGGYSYYQEIVHNIHPPTNVYPTYCQNTTICATAGSLEDGSGPNNYQNNTHCTYIIQPVNGKSVTITLAELDLEENHDYLEIWDGDPNDGGLLVSSYTGNTFNPSSSDYVVSPAVYVVFRTDGHGTAQGWKLRFTSKRFTTCVSTRTYTDPSGSFSDGSDEEVYASDADCKWVIEPNNATYVNLSFNQFDFSNEDFIEVYDGRDITTANLLGSYTGSTLPSNLRSNTGVITVHMVTDNYLERDGFTASWNSDGQMPDTTEVGIGSLEMPDVEFAVFPNPAQTSIYLEIPSTLSDGIVRICDMNGRIVYTESVRTLNAQKEIPVSQFANGVYVITLSNSSQIYSKKLVINK